MGSTSHFLAEDKLREKSNYHGWKMSLDLTLKEQEVLDYVQDKIPKPPSNAPVAAKTKHNRAKVKATKIIRDSIDKCLGHTSPFEDLQGDLRQVDQHVQF